MKFVPDWVGPTAVFSLFLSFISGFIIGATEIISTFQFRRKLLATPSFWFFLLLYGCAGTAAFLILATHRPDYWGRPLMALLVGLAPHVLLRSRFSLLRSHDESGGRKLDVSLDLEKVFNTWVKFVKGRIDVSSMPDRRRVIEALIARHPTIDEMRKEVVKILYALQTMDEADRAGMVREAEEIFEAAEDERDELCLYQLADMALRYSDYDALKTSLEMNGPPEAAVSVEVEPTPDPVVRFLEADPDFFKEIHQWKERVSPREWAYLEERIIRNPELRNKARVAAKFLHKRGYI